MPTLTFLALRAIERLICREFKGVVEMDLPTVLTRQVSARKRHTSICLALALLVSTEAKARGGSGGAFGLEIMFGLVVLFAIWWLVAQVSRETKQMIFGYVIAAAVVLATIQFIYNVLS